MGREGPPRRFSAPKASDELTNPWGDGPRQDLQSTWSWRQGEATIHVELIVGIKWTRFRTGLYARDNSDVHAQCRRLVNSALAAMIIIPANLLAVIVTDLHGYDPAAAVAAFLFSAIVQPVLLRSVVRAVKTRNAPYCDRCCGCFNCCGASLLGALAVNCRLVALCYLLCAFVAAVAGIFESMVLVVVAAGATYLLCRIRRSGLNLKAALLRDVDVFTGGAVVLEPPDNGGAGRGTELPAVSSSSDAKEEKRDDAAAAAGEETGSSRPPDDTVAAASRHQSDDPSV